MRFVRSGSLSCLTAPPQERGRPPVCAEPKLLADAILEQARALGCVGRNRDTLIALTTTRSYRAAFSHDRAIQILASEVSVTIDPRLFKIFRDQVAPRILSASIDAGHGEAGLDRRDRASSPPIVA